MVKGFQVKSREIIQTNTQREKKTENIKRA